MYVAQRPSTWPARHALLFQAMPQYSEIALPDIAYNRTDYTALRAYCSGVDVRIIADRYYSDDSPEFEQGLERFLKRIAQPPGRPPARKPSGPRGHPAQRARETADHQPLTRLFDQGGRRAATGAGAHPPDRPVVSAGDDHLAERRGHLYDRRPGHAH